MKTKRIVPGRCCGVIVDVQRGFLAQVDKRRRDTIVEETANLVRLLDHLRIPIVVTVEQPVDQKGLLPKTIARHLGARARTFEKNYFDLSKEGRIRRHIAGLKRKQLIVAGCETDVCVLQSCLGLLDLGYQVYVVEDLLFSSTQEVGSAIERMKAAGAVFLTCKTLFYELVQSVDASHRVDDAIDKLTAA